MESNVISEDYCSYEVAKLLKEKGFNWMCYGYYNKDDEDSEPYFGDGEGADNWNEQPLSVKELWYSAPTLQMAMKYLRKRHIIIVIVPAYFNGEQCASWDIDIWVDGNYKHPFEDYPTYEQAVDSALKYCLTEIL